MGISTHRKNGMDLDCSITNSQINFSIKNKINIEQALKMEASGIGWKCSKETDLLYPNRYSLTIGKLIVFFRLN